MHTYLKQKDLIQDYLEKIGMDYAVVLEDASPGLVVRHWTREELAAGIVNHLAGSE